MKIRALKSFAPLGQPPVSEGDEVEVPDGSDYVKAGLAIEIKPKRKPRKKKTDA